MRAGYIRNTLPSGSTLAAVLTAALILSGCATYGYGPDPYHDDKVAVCHKGKKTLMLPESAVDAHIGHGDTLGPCN